MTFHLEFTTDNDAFYPALGMEICATLRELIHQFESGQQYLDRDQSASGNLRDSNGNTIGHWLYKPHTARQVGKALEAHYPFGYRSQDNEP